MTKISPEIETKMPMEAVPHVSADVSFISDSFPKYKLGADHQVFQEPAEDNNGPSLKDVIEQEASNLSDQNKRISVRDLASKFDKNLSAAAKLSNEVISFIHNRPVKNEKRRKNMFSLSHFLSFFFYFALKWSHTFFLRLL
jgi:hypothetical protein